MRQHLYRFALALALVAACSAPAPQHSRPAAAVTATPPAVAAVPVDAEPDGGQGAATLAATPAATLMARALAFDLPPPDLRGRQPLALWATFYYIPRVAHDPAGFALRNLAGVELGPHLARRDWCEGAMQGTLVVTMPDHSAATYNYSGVRDEVEVDCGPVYPKHPAIGRSRYALAEGPWGDGVDGMQLVPFRSIAVDSTVIAYDALVYIPEARGTELRLPSGEAAIHDGYFYAADRGGAIKDNHIDVFVGEGRHSPFAFVRSKREPTFAAHVLSDGGASSPALAEPVERLRGAHRP